MLSLFDYFGDFAMRKSSAPNDAAHSACRERCYECYRPLDACYCETLPRIDNRTEILLLQHARERFHPFNTARMVKGSLRNCRLLVDFTDNLAEAELPLGPNSGVLYPSPGARLLDSLAPVERPGQLVILDGTWSHAKTMARDIPSLRELPHYRLAPAEPGKYRIRLEPTETALSTVEATVAALRALEPDTTGGDRLLEAFQGMVERQLAHPCAEYERQTRPRPRQMSLNLPRVLLENLEPLVVVYGEANPGLRGAGRRAAPPVFWVAERLGSGERFACALEPCQPLEARHMELFQLGPADFAGACSPCEARRRWNAFHRPTDRLVAYNQGTVDLLHELCGARVECLTLKAVNFHPRRRYASLDHLIEGEGILSPAPSHPSRAGSRLANAVALTRYLHALANAG